MNNYDKFHFLSGLPRSGSTLLGSILNKSPAVYVSPTSPVLDLLCKTEETFQTLEQQYTIWENYKHNLFRSIIRDSYPQHKIHVFDKHRGWPRNINIANQYLNRPFDGIVTIRPVAEIIVSFLKLMRNDPNNFINVRLSNDRKPINIRNQADYLWRYYIADSYNSTKTGLENNRDKILIVRYNDLVTDTNAVLKDIENFFLIPKLTHLDLSYISNTCAESKDEAWGLKDLHLIRPTIEKTSDSALDVLGQELFDYYSKFDIL
jgi:sulfotransferase